MSYRRMGDGPRGGNRSFSQPFQSGPVNPWQGSSNQNQGGILSQLTSNPQLALALTSLLQPQQQPPSLLSLNTAPAFSDRGDYGRFNVNRGRDFRRPEPYYKNRSFGDRRRRSPKRDRKNDKKPDNKKSDKEKKEDKLKAKEDGDVSMEDDEKESKRDWKDEKNHADGKEGDEEGKGMTKEGEKEGKYSGVPRKFLNCFVCNKQMWDGESMGKHVRGRAHQEMMKAVEESIHICVNILRENMRLTEDRKMIEWNRQNRLKKYGKRPRDSDLSHCNMCDLKFMGKIVAHRRTEGHQRLKNYLHPNCKVCDKEFPSRLEWIDHRLTPEHLRCLHKAVEGSEDEKDGQTITEDDSGDTDLEPLLDENLQMESEDAILEVGTHLDNFQNRLPAYKPNRPVATESLKEFAGFMCELCNRSFVDGENAQEHLKSQRHFYRFVDVIKEKYEEKERKEKAEKEAAERKKKEAKVKTENGEKEVKEGDAEEETEGDAEMYDPAETTTEEKETEEEAGGDSTMDDTVKDEVEEEEEEEEEEKEEKAEPEAKKVEVKEVKKDPPETPKTPATPAKKVAGPRSRRGRK